MAKINDDEILAALISNRTITAAASALGISPRTIHSRMQSGTFRARLEALRADTLRAVCGELQQASLMGALTLTEIMSDAGAPHAARLAAAREALRFASDYSGRLRALEAEHGRAACDLALDDLVLNDLWDDDCDED